MATGAQLQSWVQLTGPKGGRYYISRSGQKIYGAPPHGVKTFFNTRTQQVEEVGGSRRLGPPSRSNLLARAGKRATEARPKPKEEAPAKPLIQKPNVPTKPAPAVPKQAKGKSRAVVKPDSETTDVAKLNGVQTSKSGRQTYEGVNTKLIDRVAHYKNHPSGLKAVIHRNDGGRPVYKYDDKALQARSEKKFAKAQKMAAGLPRLRQEIDRDMTSPDPRTRAAATVAKLIDSHYIRVGGSDAEKKTGSAGASTLRSKHIKENPDGTVSIQFQGKSRKQWDVTVTDPKTVANLRSFKRDRAPNDQIFPVGPQQVNGYLKSKLPGTTAKDFRTFHAGRLAFDGLKAAGPPKTRAEAEKTVKAVIKGVAKQLGHTPAVCRKSYVNPAIIERYMEGTL